MKFPLRGGAVEDHAEEVLSCRGAHLLDKFVEQFFFSHAPPLGPPSTKSTKSTETAKRAAIISSARWDEIFSADGDREQQYDQYDHQRQTETNEHHGRSTVRIGRRSED